MTDVGLEANFVDAQDVSLTNVTDSKTYKQLQNVTVSIQRKLYKHQLTNDTIENLGSLRDVIISGVITLTNPQISDLVALTGTGAAAPAVKSWEIQYTDSSKTKKTITISAQLFGLDFIDPNVGILTEDFRLIGTQTVTVATPT